MAPEALDFPERRRNYQFTMAAITLEFKPHRNAAALQLGTRKSMIDFDR
jgi:hypothetical protein